VLNTLITVLAICSVESDYRNVINWDDGGSPSIGICQVKESTAIWMLSKDKKYYTPDLMNEYVNFNIALKYYSWQLKRYKGDERCAISAYNGGRCLKSNQKTYVDKVLRRRDEKTR
jgi:soluble lytic murein transglycosylase-like protein